jgi:hypothetical protein
MVRDGKLIALIIFKLKAKTQQQMLVEICGEPG